MIKRLHNEGVAVEYNTEMKEIKGDDAVKAVVLINNKTGEQKEVSADWIVICVGTEPDVKLAQAAGIQLTGPTGKIVKINDQMMTNKVGVFACGEITGCHNHLITAASEGASAGMAASEYLALEKVKRGEMFTGAINGKYASEYLKEISAEYI
jgi:thioredoxin reductase (NADPH)